MAIVIRTAEVRWSGLLRWWSLPSARSSKVALLSEAEPQDAHVAHRRDVPEVDVDRPQSRAICSHANVYTNFSEGSTRMEASAGCSDLARRLSSPPFACMRECAHLAKAKQPCNLRYMQLPVLEISNCQIVP